MTIAPKSKYRSIAQIITHAMAIIAGRWAKAEILESGLDTKRTPIKTLWKHSLAG